ncbi:methyl-accepting chemotaxis protein [Cellulosilyticum sp. ST5]|uniref:methyl-accepting chemotaxis protein n=1 Tax=unclassified Cellulosilyticum TaxID=2643091 RepID=UPI000F8CF9C4|nr:methyl-accepting chemotaxis protein [Cellulosilyticum sp. WCF-2]QEH68035.1 methyl-accepting chemotaxis protein [Cellulosilyticum sp. WCF-2]
MKFRLNLRLKGRLYALIIPMVLVISIVFTILGSISFVFNTTSLVRDQMKTNMIFFNFDMDSRYPGSYKKVENDLIKGDESLTGIEEVHVLKKYTGYEYIIFCEQTIIASTIKEVNSDELISNEIIDRVLKQGKLFQERRTIKGISYTCSYEPIKDEQGTPIGMLFMAADRSKHIANIENYLKWTLITTLILLLAAFIAMGIVSTRISRRIISVCEQVDYLKDKDFTYEASNYIQEFADETGDISRSVTQMQKDIRETLVYMNHLADQVDSESAGLSNSSEDMAKVIDNITMTIQGVAEGTVDQATDLVGINEEAHALGNGIAQVISSVDQINQKAEQINEVALKGNEDIKEVMKALRIFGEYFNNYSEKINSFENHMKNIDEIIIVIENISKQTNLLALNAAIEAARAGEMGRGFSVVAEEIRNLAEQSQMATKNIAEIIGNASVETKVLIEGNGEMTTQLEHQDDSLKQMFESFKLITKAVEEIVPQIKSVNEEAHVLERQKESILMRIENSSSIAEEVSASCEEVSAACEEANTATEEVAQSAMKLKDMINQLKDNVHTFKV